MGSAPHQRWLAAGEAWALQLCVAAQPNPSHTFCRLSGLSAAPALCAVMMPSTPDPPPAWHKAACQKGSEGDIQTHWWVGGEAWVRNNELKPGCVGSTKWAWVS